MILNKYIWALPNAFSEIEVQEIERLALQNEIQDALVGDNQLSEHGEKQEGKSVSEIRTSSLRWIENLSQPLEDKVADLVNQCYSDTGWYWNILHHQTWQYTVYNEQPNRKKGDFYTWHTDAGPNTYADGTIRKLSCTIQLSNPNEYEGGHFQWLDATAEFDRMQDSPIINMTNSIQTIPFSMKQKGTIIFFPSFLHHQVTPVLRGQRKSLVGWFVGPPYA
jgi:PKHD-type hydroxylase